MSSIVSFFDLLGRKMWYMLCGNYSGFEHSHLANKDLGNEKTDSSLAYKECQRRNWKIRQESVLNIKKSERKDYSFCHDGQNWQVNKKLWVMIKGSQGQMEPYGKSS